MERQINAKYSTATLSQTFTITAGFEKKTNAHMYNKEL